MQAALIIMTILGCDDTATQCHFVEMRSERFATVQACDAVSEDKLRTYSNLDYPVVVAVCQTPEDTGLAEVADEPAQELAQLATPDADTSLTDIPAQESAVIDRPEQAMLPETAPGVTTRVLNLVREALPEKARVKALVSQPVHVVTDSYSWVVQRFEK
jgi:hypothetical protein